MNRQRLEFLQRPVSGYPNWRRVKMKSVDVGVRHDKHLYNDYRYTTKGECLTAQVLDQQDIDYTQDVRFELRKKIVVDGQPPAKYEDVVYVPDFIFNRDTYLWTAEDGCEYTVHGIECKSSNRLPEKVTLLFERRNIRIIVLTAQEIKAYDRLGCFPLRLLRRYCR
jgi:hypothetical protein